MNSVDMIDVGESFERALEHVLNNTLGASHTHVVTFLTNHVLRSKPWMLLTNDGVESSMNSVMGDAELQDFVLEVTYTFSAYWGGSIAKYADLADVLATSVGIQSESALPTEVKQRTITPEQAKQKLTANRWLMTLILFNLFVEPAMVDGKKVELEVAKGA